MFVPGISRRLGSFRSWLASDWRHAGITVAVVVAAVITGSAVAAAMVASRGVAADVSPSALPSATQEPSPTPTSEPSVSPSPELPSATPTPAPTAQPTATPAAVAGEWAPMEIPGLAYVTDIAERNGRLVALGSDDIDTPGTAMAYSDDGSTWTSVDLSAIGLGGARLHDVGAGDPGFVAFGFPPQSSPDSKHVYLYSVDGASWEPATPPDECIGGGGAQWVGGRFVAFGGLCGLHGGGPPGPAMLLTSSDGRGWDVRVDDSIHSGPWATDGERIVLLPGCCDTETRLAISDDGADSWRFVSDPALEDVTIYSLAHGHDRWVAEASWLIREGDPDHAVCVSDTGESWSCEILGPTSAATPELRAVGAVTATTTGFVSLKFAFDDQFAPSGTTTILGTSTDGVSWTFRPLPEMKDTSPMGTLASPDHGVFVWGLHRPEDAVVATPVLLRHPAQIP